VFKFPDKSRFCFLANVPIEGSRLLNQPSDDWAGGIWQSGYEHACVWSTDEQQAKELWPVVSARVRGPSLHMWNDERRSKTRPKGQPWSSCPTCRSNLEPELYSFLYSSVLSS
jgi:hypothetical protein